MVSSRIKRKYGYWWYPDPRDKEPVEKPTAFNKKKNTKKWCRGKVGREHQPIVCVPKNAYRPECGVTVRFVKWENGERVTEKAWFCAHHVECSVCGKELQWNPDVCPLNETDYKMYWR